MAVEHDRELPDDLRKRAVDWLRQELHPQTLVDIKEAYDREGNSWSIQHHFLAGMAFRNLLREIIKDDELPPVEYDDGNKYSNWDDYYVVVVEEAAGCYEKQGA